MINDEKGGFYLKRQEEMAVIFTEPHATLFPLPATPTYFLEQQDNICEKCEYPIDSEEDRVMSPASGFDSHIQCYLKY